ncbi:Acetyltransferase [Nitrosospira sp. NRS527]|nr:GNAT family N-acetyltransferase [Nitrosospira sp. NRS527]BCT66828.1 Acetyltransferase [Nitrosospira sp. NRS527]
MTLLVKEDVSAYTVRIASWQDDIRALRRIREAVFIYEQGVPAELEWDEFDVNCIHVLASDSAANPVGTARLLLDGSIGRMAVLREYRGKRVGTALMQRLLREAESRQMQQVTLNAQVYAIEFYKKFGFRVTGKAFLDAGISHVRMVLR